MVGQEAKRLYEEALQMLDKIVTQNLLQAKGIVGFYVAQVSSSITMFLTIVFFPQKIQKKYSTVNLSLFQVPLCRTNALEAS